MTKAIYKIQYYQQDKRFGWSNTVHDKVLAISQEQAIEKFKKKHPDVKTYSVVDIIYANY